MNVNLNTLENTKKYIDLIHGIESPKLRDKYKVAKKISSYKKTYILG